MTKICYPFEQGQDLNFTASFMEDYFYTDKLPEDAVKTSYTDFAVMTYDETIQQNYDIWISPDCTTVYFVRKQ